MISRIVGRLHVSTSNLEVCRYVISRLKGKRKAFRAMPRESKRALLAECITCHMENREFYRYVTGGIA